MLLDAKPVATSVPYWSPVRNHAQHSLLDSLKLPTPGAPEAIAQRGVSHLRRVNDLLSSIQRDTQALGLRSLSSESLTVDDVTASGRREREARNLLWKSTDRNAPRWSRSSPEKPVTSTGATSQRRNRARSQPVLYARKPPAHDRLKRAPTLASKSERSALSSATENSIISGNLQKGRSRQQVRAPNKCASTPKRGLASSKQLRFDVDSPASRGSSRSLDLSRIHAVPDEKADFSFGRKEIIGILKPPTPKRRLGGSHVSFTTDDLIGADASGLTAHERSGSERRSRSMPRDALLQETSMARQQLREGRTLSNVLDAPDDSLDGLPRPLVATKSESDVPQQARYEQFIANLMREVEDLSSTATDVTPVPSTKPQMHNNLPPLAATPPRPQKSGLYISLFKIVVINKVL